MYWGCEIQVSISEGEEGGGRYGLFSSVLNRKESTPLGNISRLSSLPNGMKTTPLAFSGHGGLGNLTWYDYLTTQSMTIVM